MCYFIFGGLWFLGLIWVAHLVIKAPYMDDNGNYIGKNKSKIFEQQDRLYH